MAYSAAMEAKTVRAMIIMYCLSHHQGSKQQLCSACRQVEQYALARIDKCPWGELKPVCSTCEVHCYKLDMREQIKEIMRYSGPRMLRHHPVLAIRYLYRKRFRRKKGR